jgi:hypothetical protein
MRSRRRFSASRWLRDAASARSWAAAAAAASSSSEAEAEPPAPACQTEPMKKGGRNGTTPPSPGRAAPVSGNAADTSAGNMRQRQLGVLAKPSRLVKFSGGSRRAPRTELGRQR